MDQGEFQSCAARIEPLVQRAAALPDAAARAAALDLLQAVLDVHGAVVARLIELLVEAGEPGRELLARCGEDPLIGGLLILYGLHPIDLEARVLQAVEKLKPLLRAQSVEVSGVEVGAGGVQVTLAGAAPGCGGHAGGVSQKLEQAIWDAAPDAAAVHVELKTPGQGIAGFVPLSALLPPPRERKQYEESTA